MKRGLKSKFNTATTSLIVSCTQSPHINNIVYNLSPFWSLLSMLLLLCALVSKDRSKQDRGGHSDVIHM